VDSSGAASAPTEGTRIMSFQVVIVEIGSGEELEIAVSSANAANYEEAETLALGYVRGLGYSVESLSEGDVAETVSPGMFAI
jgi:hypothetical protein